MESRVLIAVVMLAALLAGIWGRISLQDSRSAQNDVQVLVDFQLPDLDGHLRTVREWQENRLLIINFWASWCPPCLEELPVFERLQQQYRPLGVQILGVSLDTAADAKLFLAQHPLSYPQLVAGDAGINLSQSLGNRALAVPFTILVNSRGELVHRQFGAISATELEALITAFL